MRPEAAQLLLFFLGFFLLLGAAEWPQTALAASSEGEEAETEDASEPSSPDDSMESSDSLEVDEPSELAEEHAEPPAAESSHSQEESVYNEALEEAPAAGNELQQQQQQQHEPHEQHVAEEHQHPTAEEEEEESEEYQHAEAASSSATEEGQQSSTSVREEESTDAAADETEFHGLQHVDSGDSSAEGETNSTPAESAEAESANTETAAADAAAEPAAAAAAAPAESDSSTAASSSEPSEKDEEEKKPDEAPKEAAEAGEQQQQQQQPPQDQLQEQLGGGNGAVADPRQGRCSASELEKLAAYFADGSACPAFGCIDTESSNYLELIEKHYKDEYTPQEQQAFAGVLAACHCRCPVMQCEVEYINRNGSQSCQEATREFCLQSNSKFSEKCAMVAQQLPKVYDIDADTQAFKSPCQVCGESADGVAVAAMAASEGAALSTSPGALVFAASLSGVLASILLL